MVVLQYIHFPDGPSPALDLRHVHQCLSIITSLSGYMISIIDDYVSFLFHNHTTEKKKIPVSRHSYLTNTFTSARITISFLDTVFTLHVLNVMGPAVIIYRSHLYDCVCVCVWSSNWTTSHTNTFANMYLHPGPTSSSL